MDPRKLQRVVVDALDDIKAQDIRVFDTTAQTELFDRVIIATGTSNRQTRALATHVRDKVKEAGAPVRSLEGADTGEWVLVDLGDIVVHVMQPAIRQYYNLEEIWGSKPVRLRIGARAPTAAATKRASAGGKRTTAAAKRTAEAGKRTTGAAERTTAATKRTSAATKRAGASAEHTGTKTGKSAASQRATGARKQASATTRRTAGTRQAAPAAKRPGTSSPATTKRTSAKRASKA